MPMEMYLLAETVEIHRYKLMAYLSLLRVEVRAAQEAQQVQQRAEVETDGVAMEEDTRAVPAGQITLLLVAPGLDISLMIPALDEPVAVAAVVAFPEIMQLTQQQKAVAYRMVEKEEYKTIRTPGLLVAVREAVVAALVVLMVTAALAALAKCIFVFIFKGV